MLWPLQLPFLITCLLMGLFVLAVAILSARLKWNPTTASFFAVFIAVLAFIPSCTGVMMVVDSVRFGAFEFASFDEINDFRAERYMPPNATKISMVKFPACYYAKYVLSKEALEAYLDELWREYGHRSASKRGAMYDEGKTAYREQMNLEFRDLNWELPNKSTVYYSPSESDGGGAKYYYDAQSGVVYQRTAYW